MGNSIISNVNGQMKWSGISQEEEEEAVVIRLMVGV